MARFRAILLLSLLVLVPSGLLAAGGISGRVTAASGGAPLEADVVIMTADDYGEITSIKSSAADGSYFAGDLPDGNYRAKVSIANSVYVSVFYDGSVAGTPYWDKSTTIAVAGSAVTGGIDFAMTEGGVIAGTVRAKADGAPVVGKIVTFHDPTSQYYWYGESGPDGTYWIPGLPPGAYYGHMCYLLGDFVCQFWDHTDDAYQSSRIEIAGAQVVEQVDFDLVVGAAVSGRLLSKDNGGPVPKGKVSAVRINGYGGNTVDAAADGSFRVNALTAGTYYLYAGGKNYAGDYGRNSDGAVLNFDLAIGQEVEGVDIRLEEGGIVTGTVRAAATGAPIAGAHVEVVGLDGEWTGLEFPSTGVDGKFEISAIKEGDYLVFANHPDFITQFYSGAIFGANGTPVHVTKGQTKAAVDFALLPAGKISGRVVSKENGQPIERIYLLAFFDENLEMPGAWAQAASDGTYTMGSVIPGARVYVAAVDWDLGVYAAQWYSGAYQFSEARSVAVAIGQTTAGVNFSLEKPGVVTFSPASIAFTGQTLQETIPSQQLLLKNAGPGPAAVVVWSDADWMSVDLDESRPLDPGEDRVATINVWTWGLAAGTYTGGLHVYDISIQTEWIVPVTFTLAAAAPALEFYPDGMWFDSEAHSQVAPEDTFYLANVGDGVIEYSLAADVPWITFSPASGSLVHAENASQLTVAVSAAGLDEGTYNGTITLTSSVGSYQIPVEFNVTPAITEGVPGLSTPSVVTILVPGGLPPEKARLAATATFEISNPGTATLYWNARFRDDWVALTPSKGAIEPGGPATTVTVQVDPAKLGNGMNSTVLDFASSRVSASVSLQAQIGSLIESNGKIVPSGQGQLVVPVMVHSPGLNGSQFASDIWISHLPIGKSSTLTVGFVPDGVDGTQAAVSTSLE